MLGSLADDASDFRSKPVLNPVTRFSTRHCACRYSRRLPPPPPPSDSLSLSLYIHFFSWWRIFQLQVVQKMFSVEKFVASNGRVVWGWLFLIVGAFSFMIFLYAAVISKIQPPSQNVIIRAIQNDWYYCFLVPLTLPILFVAVYFHWLSMKLFKHA